MCQSSCISSLFPLLCVVLDILCIRGNKGILNLNLNLVNNVLPLMTDSPAFLTRPSNIAHSAWMHGTLWNAIFASLIASEIDVIDTLRFNNDVDYLYRLATVLETWEMRLNHEYWCEPECTWQTNSINKTATSWQLGFQTLERYWASFQVTRLSQCNQFFQPGRICK